MEYKTFSNNVRTIYVKKTKMSRLKMSIKHGCIRLRAKPSTARLSKTGFCPISAIRARVFCLTSYFSLENEYIWTKKFLMITEKTYWCSMSQIVEYKCLFEKNSIWKFNFRINFLRCLIMWDNFYHRCVVRRVDWMCDYALTWAVIFFVS